VHGTGNEELNTDFDFPGAANSRVSFGKDSVYDITFSAGSPVLAADLSNLFTTPDGSGHDYLAVAHLAGYGGTSAGIVGHIASVPEPSSLVTSGLGIVGLALAYAFRRHRKVGEVHRVARQPG
jgi:hypothetical protein